MYCGAQKVMYNYKVYLSRWSGAPELAGSNQKLLSEKKLELKMIAHSVISFSTNFIKELVWLNHII
jgi:hypothetical protein